MVTPVAGYRILSEAELAAINAVKAKGNEIGGMIAEMEQNPTIDQRWLKIAKHDLQVGFMELVRSIAQPKGF